jgi:hypothetical protein
VPTGPSPGRRRSARHTGAWSRYGHAPCCRRAARTRTQRLLVCRYRLVQVDAELTLETPQGISVTAAAIPEGQMHRVAAPRLSSAWSGRPAWPTTSNSSTTTPVRPAEPASRWERVATPKAPTSKHWVDLTPAPTCRPTSSALGWPKLQSVYIIDLVAQSHRHKIE